MNQFRIVPLAFRAALMALAALAWLTVAYLAFHQSEQPTVLGRYSAAYAAALSVAALLALLVTLASSRLLVGKIYAAMPAMVTVAVATIVSVSVAEIAVRTLDPLGISYYKESERYELDKEADENLVYRHPANIVRTYQNVEVRINEFRMRDDPVLPKRDGELRIVLLGDSVAFGWGVEQEKIFAARLEPLLAERLQTPVTVINSGVGSYNTTQQLTWLTDVGLDLDPDAIVLLYVNNDIQEHRQPFNPRANLSLSGKSPPQIVSLLAGRLWTYRLVSHVLSYGGRDIGSDEAVAQLRSSPGWQDSMRALSAIVGAAAERRVRAGFFYFSWDSSRLDQALFADIQAAVAPWPTAETRRWFDGADFRRYTNSRVDSHPNQDGHAVLAAGMSAALDSILRER